jgi:hypothetical protein
MLAGIMRGMQYDSRAMAGLRLLEKHGIYSRDQQATHYRRAARAIVRSGESAWLNRSKVCLISVCTGAVQKRTIDAHDAEVHAAYKKLVSLQNAIQTRGKALKRAVDSGNDINQEARKLRKKDTQLEDLHTEFKQLQDRSSGMVPTPDLKDPRSLFDRRLLNVPAPRLNVIANEPYITRFAPPRDMSTQPGLTTLPSPAEYPATPLPDTFPLGLNQWAMVRPFRFEPCQLLKVQLQNDISTIIPAPSTHYYSQPHFPQQIPSTPLDTYAGFTYLPQYANPCSNSSYPNRYGRDGFEQNGGPSTQTKRRG